MLLWFLVTGGNTLDDGEIQIWNDQRVEAIHLQDFQQHSHAVSG